MAKYIYTRVSTLQQDYAQQRNTIDRYLENNRISQDEIDSELVEKITGVNEHTKRKFAHLFAKCKAGDIIYFSELSRIGRNMSDLNNIVHDACERGIILMQCKDGMRIEDETVGGKALLFALSLAAEIEVQNLRQRTRSGVEAAMQEIESKGQRTTKQGTVQTHWGNKRGSEQAKAACAKARIASAIAKQEKMIAWRENSMAVKAAMRYRAEGWGVVRITEALGHSFDDYAATHPNDPNPYATPTGCRPSKGHVSRWLSEANPLTLV